MNQNILFLFAAVVIVGGLLFVAIGLTRRGVQHLDVEKYRTKWFAIEHQLDRSNVASFSMCVLNADKLVDQALRERGIKGQTMADRMKTMSGNFSNRNAIWQAHKLRNHIAHDTDSKVTYDSARSALSGFKQALKDLGAI
jgi:hypothetical protein